MGASASLSTTDYYSYTDSGTMSDLVGKFLIHMLTGPYLHTHWPGTAIQSAVLISLSFALTFVICLFRVDLEFQSLVAELLTHFELVDDLTFIS